ncbi:MAG: PKD domain-containing protein [Streptomyces sp.]|uniref:PKD domain-containing protein n=1 Tax=Streptomyces sp. TaxID=1931 RepID=UPI0025F79D67|nr:PKD domain-containing protein [Streptomyces sp.]MBW8796183.1 PKD domain-containing protein [Streptomyces sp.]
MVGLLGAGLALAPSVARADGNTLYVNNLSTSNCSDSAAGSGSQAQPYCSLQTAVDAAQPGDTVMVVRGIFGPLDVKTSGTASAPITITTGTSKALIQIVTPPSGSGPALTLDHVHDVAVHGFFIGTNVRAPVVAVEGSSEVTLDGDRVGGAYSGALVSIDGQSNALTLSRDDIETQPGEDGVDIASGASGTVITGSEFYYGKNTPVNAAGAPGTVVVGNTFTDDGGCNTAIALTGTSSGSTIENNAFFLGTSGGCATYGTSTPVVVSSGSTSGTTYDYNVFESESDGALYSWGGQTYATAADLQTATGQGKHELYVAVALDRTGLNITPLIDSADADAPDELSTDFNGKPRVDDSLVADTGTGTGYYDRGATEYQDPYQVAPAVSVDKGPAPLSETITADETNPWKTRITSYTFNFGDGSDPVVSATPSVTHAYAAIGSYPVTVTATTAAGASVAGSKKAYVNVAAVAPLVPALSFSQAYPYSSLTVRADATKTTDDWSIADYSVDYGDGTPAADLGTSGVGGHTYAKPGTYTATLTVKDDGGNTATSTQQVTVGSAFVPFGPTRILDTRNGTGAAKAKVGPGAVLRLKVAGVKGVPATGVTAVTLNLTGVNASAGTVITAYPDGTARPTASNLNLVPGQVTPNLITVPVSANGYIDLYNHSGSVDLLGDVEGYYSTTAAVALGGTGLVQTTGPTRVLDTRNGTGTIKGKVGPGGLVTLTLPSGSYTNASAVLLNVTETNATASSWVGLEPSAGGVPTSSVLNFAAGQTSANLVVAPVSGGQVQFYNRYGGVHLVADLEGYVVSDVSDSPAALGLPYFPVSPIRVLDTRNGTGTAQGALGAKSKIGIKVTGSGGVPAGAKAVLVNVTGVKPTIGTWLFAYADGSALPGSSTLNLAPGTTRANLALVPVGSNGSIDIYNNSGSVNAVADIEGYYIG